MEHNPDSELNKTWSDEDRDALSQLLSQFWIRRDQQPELFRRIHNHRNLFKEYFLEKCGFLLIVKPTFVKLEKIPDAAEPWMGIEDFQSTRDYALLCCLLAVLDEKAVDEQFLLSEITEAVKTRYPAQADADPESALAAINWERYPHRKAMVRVMRFAVERGLLNEVDGAIDDFAANPGGEVLYEITLLSRYFTISYPKDLFGFNTIEDIIDGSRSAESETDRRRHRIYRRLFLTPSYTRDQADDTDFAYLRNLRNRMRDDLEKATPFRMELGKHCAMFTITEPRAHQHLFPARRGIDDIVLLFAHQIRDHFEQDSDVLDAKGSLELSHLEFSNHVDRLKRSVGHGFSKEYRDMSPQKLANRLLRELCHWNMARDQPHMALVQLLPTLARLTGAFPRDFLKKSKDKP